MKTNSWLWLALVGAWLIPCTPNLGQEVKLAPPTDLVASDHAWDGGTNIDLTWTLSADDVENARPRRVEGYRIYRSGEENGLYADLGLVLATSADRARGVLHYRVEKCEPGEDYYFRVKAMTPAGSLSSFAQAKPARPVEQAFAKDRLWLAILIFLLCAAILYWIQRARSGHTPKVRRIAGLEAMQEAVGRATETGRPCLFVPGVQDMNEIQTIAGLTVLSKVARTAAEYGAKVEVPTSRSLVMTAARETVQAAFLAAGRPDAYSEDHVYYVTDEQFGYVAYLTGHMVREKPAACFYMGSFFAESLILAETGNAIGAIQMAGTAQPSQLPFFVAACDYTLIGEEFFAASAYLSGEPAQMGSLKGQDTGKVLVAFLIVIGCCLATWESLTGAEWARLATRYLVDVVLGSQGS